MRAIVPEKFGGLDSLVSRDIPEPSPKPGTSSSKSRRSASTTPRCTCDAAAAPVLPAGSGNLDPIPDFNPLHAEADVRRLAIPAEEHVLRQPSAHNRTEPMNRTGWPRRISLAVEQICEAEVAPAVKAQMLRELAAWYRILATRAGNPVVWESRLLTAEDLDAQAGRLEQERDA